MQLDERLLKVTQFALRRFIFDAYNRANQAAQDKSKRFFKAGDAETFLKDAKDAEKAAAYFDELINNHKENV